MRGKKKKKDERICVKLEKKKKMNFVPFLFLCCSGGFKSEGVVKIQQGKFRKEQEERTL
jgi:hypothetical protein